ncbi:hypothetical protein G4H71_18105 [Rhodococcus triatomae]|uniref:Uncharacterized protein n=1 Tax=Rhodococcus triatomae TaxID=300028 RepID=A0A1G8F443_9NOCA|nr:hypothetical protein [Rhodococcus triatomae]QNG19383.1 hypothetical protein G4H72_12270 [Rhodococcus triatomae]QNG24704.1 hypothetical protein G4H71_18105 [Rhodococcus triatomae]SDH76905.1 hypothetical protein SAMN05444695_103166 [Rhodococcus triatomae]
MTNWSTQAVVDAFVGAHASAPTTRLLARRAAGGAIVRDRAAAGAAAVSSVPWSHVVIDP